MTLPIDVYDLPIELTCKPQPLIGLTGLDALNNSVHSAIWDTFTTNRRSDKKTVQYKLYGPDHEFPQPKKAKRNSYEFYIPKGILKRNWMNKYVNEIPSVLVVFFDLDWYDSFWNEKKLECASKIKAVRASLESRFTRIVLVLVQQMPTLPSGDDSTAERAASLCNTCELNSKYLFLLPHSDHLREYTMRLESAFYELAQTFYQQKIRTIRSHKDHLNKTTHQYLYVRHQYKMAFLSELKQDPTSAIKHYSQCYGHLLDVRMADTNAMEIKIIASFINYKLCLIAFSMNLPRDAISQFRKHIETFKLITGSKELAFEHHAWLSKQFCLFGELFDEAIHHGLPATQTQHPGIYFQQAAQYAVDRKLSCYELCKDIIVYPHPDPLNGIEDLEYYGQRPWRPGKLSAEPADVMKEKEGIQALQYKEKDTVNHSMLIIALLGSAISQAKTYRCPRTRRQLVVQMAEEYYNDQDYGKALTLLSHMLWEYRSEKWSLLLTHVLLRALDCAFLAINLQDYITLAIEAQGPHVNLNNQQKASIFISICNILKGMPPNCPETLSINQEDLNIYINKWKNILTPLPKDLAIDMNNPIGFIEAKAKFNQSSYEVDKLITVEILTRNKCVLPININRVSVVIVSPSSSIEIDGKFIKLHDEQISNYQCNFKAKDEDIGKEIQISSIHIYFGPDIENNILLRYAGISDIPNDISQELQYFRPSPKNAPKFDEMKSQRSTLILPRESHLNINQIMNLPALSGEWFPINIEFENLENNTIASINIEVILIQPTNTENNVIVDQATHLSLDPLKDTNQIALKIQHETLNKQDKYNFSFYFKSLRVGQRKLSLKVQYNLLPNKHICMKEIEIDVEIVKPFDSTAKFYSIKFETINKAYTQEPFIIMPEIKCLSPWPIYIEDTCLELASQIVSVDKKLNSHLSSVTLKQDEIGTEAFCVNAINSCEQAITVGIYNIKWKRESSCGSIITSSSITLPALIKIEFTPLYIELQLPAHGWVGTPMSTWFRLHNRTNKLLEIELNLQSSDAFMFAGHKQIKLKVLPEDVYTLSYNLYPLLSGLVSLPQLKLTPLDTTCNDIKVNQLTELIDRSLPTHVFVMPQAKGKPEMI